MADPGVSAATAVSLGQTITVYALFLPSITEVRRASSEDPQIRGDVRMGQLAGATLSIGVGVVLTQMTGSSVPVMVAAFIAAIIAGIYEFAMRGERMFENGT